MDDLDYTRDDITRILEEILRDAGPLPSQVLGQHLSRKTDPGITKFVKRHFGGLKATLESRPDKFRIDGIQPSTTVSLVSGGRAPAREPPRGPLGPPGSLTLVSSYLKDTLALLIKEDAAKLAGQMRLFGGIITAGLDAELRRVSLAEIESAADRVVRFDSDGAWGSMFGLHLQTYKLWKERKYKDCFETQGKILQAFSKYYNLQESAGLDKMKTFPISLFTVIITDLRLVARWADDGVVKNGGERGFLNASSNQLRACIPLVTDRAPLAQSRKWAILPIVNQLFKIYFFLNTINLCSPVLATIENRGYPPWDQFPIAQYVTYMFYRGRIHIFSGEYEEAAQCLLVSFDLCQRTKKRNRRLILIHLIPILAILGRFPRASMLQQYRLTQFESILAAVKDGNVHAFDNRLAQHQDFLIHRGAFVIIEKLRTLAWRNLFKKIYILLDKTDRISLVTLTAVIKASGVDTSFEEVECILANLIAQGYIKGYIAHKFKAIVISKKNPLPAITYSPTATTE